MLRSCTSVKPAIPTVWKYLLQVKDMHLKYQRYKILMLNGTFQNGVKCFDLKLVKVV